MSAALGRWAELYGRAPALADESHELSWVEADEIVTRATNGIVALRPEGAGGVAVCSENCAEWILAVVAGISAGVATVPVSFHLRADEIRHIVEDSAAHIVFTGPETVAGVAEAVAGIAADITIICWRLAEAETPAGASVVDWDEWLAGQSADEPSPLIEPIAPLLYTSGTTGRPRGVDAPPTIFPGGSTVAEYVELVRARALPGLDPAGGEGPSERLAPALIVTPLHHLSGMTLVLELIRGRPLVVLGRFDAEKTLEAIERFQIGSVFMVPTHFIRLLALPEEVRAGYDLSSLDAVSHGAAACPVELKRRVIDWLGPILHETYGGTESGGICRISSPEWLEHVGSVGRPVDYEVIVAGADGEPAAPGEVGALYFRHLRGYDIAYRNDPEKTAAAHLAPGVFTLGDIGKVDDDGYVYITDREADVVISGGVNIYPAEVERVLAEDPSVSGVAVIGVPNPEFGEEVKALVVPTDAAAPPTAEHLIAVCREGLAGYKCPRSIELIDAIPLTDVGKVNKRELRARYASTPLAEEAA